MSAIEELCADPIKVQNIANNARAKMEALDWEIVKLKWIKILGD